MSRIPLAGILILKKIGPRYWATFVIVGWGAIEVGMAFATTWGYLCFCRIILGVLEVCSNFLIQENIETL